MSSNQSKYDYSLLFAKIEDAVNLCKRRNTPVFTSFLSQEQQAQARGILRQCKYEEYLFYGGFESAERKLLGIFPEGFKGDLSLFPLTGIEFAYKQEYNLSHRDFLGAVMATGIKRDVIGDILTQSGRAVVFVKRDMANYIFSQITKIGSVGVKTSNADLSNLPPVPVPQERLYTVSSLRLDNIVSAVTGESRDKSAGLIKAGLVYVNHLVKDSVSFNVKESDTLSVRGKGKYIIGESTGYSKKGKIKLIIKHYR